MNPKVNYVVIFNYVCLCVIESQVLSAGYLFLNH